MSDDKMDKKIVPPLKYFSFNEFDTKTIRAIIETAVRYKGYEDTKVTKIQH